jgi:hypothetical protein
MKKRIAAVVLSAFGFLLGLVAPAMASNWATAQYDADGNCIGCVSKATGAHLNVTEEGCNTDYYPDEQ